MITYQELKDASQLFVSIGEIKNYITKERFELAAKCEFNITKEKSIERMFGLFCEVPNIIYRIARHDEEIKDELTTALHIAQTAYENVEINNSMMVAIEFTLNNLWVSVTEELPERNRNVLALNLNGDVLVAFHDGMETWWWCDGFVCGEKANGDKKYSSCCEIDSITHWMPIPKLMKGGEK